MKISSGFFLSIICFWLVSAMPAFSQTIANWELKNVTGRDGYYVTTSDMPTGSSVRIKVIKKGSNASITVSHFFGTNIIASTLKQWHYGELSDGRVLSFNLSKPTRVAISIGGVNFFQKPTEIVSQDGFHRMKFDGGWEIDAKVQGEAF